jgi:ubiquinone/menaquinone biosynthesis C-methylase UbiE
MQARVNFSVNTQAKAHWEHVYATKSANTVSWYQAHATLSLRLIRAAGVARDAAIIDVGGGASTLVDDLLDEGFAHLTVLDLAGCALQVSRKRLENRAASVRWLEADILATPLAANAYDVWHDRAVFHFLTAAEDRAAYVENAGRAVKGGGHLIVATFAEDGPSRCSGLPVARYSADHLHAEFSAAFTLMEQETQAHSTPSGAVQQFTYCRLRKRS